MTLLTGWKVLTFNIFKLKGSCFLDISLSFVDISLIFSSVAVKLDFNVTLFSLKSYCQCWSASPETQSNAEEPS